MTETVRIVGLHSPAPQSGKSTIAQALAAREGVVCLSIAGGIRKIARNFGLDVAADAQGAEKDDPSDDLAGKSPREVLIGIGNSYRQHLGEDVWIKMLYGEIRNLPADIHTVVIDDVRTALEGETIIDEWGGTVITIVRSSATPNPNDVQGFIPRVTIQNDGTIEEAIALVDAQIAQAFDLEVVS